MLKVSYPETDIFHNTKCGEIFCVASAVFEVTCCLCSNKMHLEQFSRHFQMKHFTLVEQSIDLESWENKQCKEIIVETEQFGKELASDPIEKDPMDKKSPSAEDLLQIKECREKIKDTEYTVEELTLNSIDYKVERIGFESTIPKEDTIITSEEGNIDKSKPRGKQPRPSRTLLKRKAKESQESIKKENVSIPFPFSEIVEKKAYPSLLAEKGREDYFNKNDCEEENTFNEDTRWSDKESNPEDDKNGTSKQPSPELPFPCAECNRRYRTKNSLRTHRFMAHNPKNLEKKKLQTKHKHQCSECQEVFSTARNLRGHMYKHTGIFCDICGKTFSQAGNMVRHRIRHTGKKDFKCKECPKEFYSAKELKLHMLSHSKVMPIICEICGKGCREKGVLRAHMRRHTGERPAKCDECGKRFFSIHDLNLHSVIHSSERPFKCDVCGSTFQRKKSLRIHKRIHSQERKHECKICDKAFAQSSGLKAHMRSHDAAFEKPKATTAQTQNTVQNKFQNTY